MHTQSQNWFGVQYHLKDGATLAFCENSYCRNLQTNKLKYIKGKFTRNLFKWSNFRINAAFLRNRQKSIFGANFFFEQG